MLGKFYIFLSSLLEEGVAHLSHLPHAWTYLIEIILELLVRMW
ncbi:hypothetical protein UFOVP735_46 [uncultured Caudovirales phage]|uniref:Uncharacterized protein n=1 Tax=uncultured Caudovirales phage TaxID=2100421 RepID=A0A6J7XA75_9CAUD|nr:hypothetical protein UFOVP735_46 [uncultured Caudovirales phage]